MIPIQAVMIIHDYHKSEDFTTVLSVLSAIGHVGHFGLACCFAPHPGVRALVFLQTQSSPMLIARLSVQRKAQLQPLPVDVARLFAIVARGQSARTTSGLLLSLPSSLETCCESANRNCNISHTCSCAQAMSITNELCGRATHLRTFSYYT